MSDQWYYAAAGQQLGPVPGEALRNLIASGQVQKSDLVWREGMAEWTAIALLPELAAPMARQPETSVAGAPIPLPPVAVQLTYGGYEPYAGNPLGGVEYGGFWIRVGAYVIDAIIMAVPNQIISAIAESSFNTPGARGMPTPSQLLLSSSVGFLPIILDWLYFSLMESSSAQATVGKMACGLIVTDVYGQRLTFGRATGRYFAKILSGLALCIGFILVGTDERKRGLHDQIAKTFVVKKKSLRPRNAI